MPYSYFDNCTFALYCFESAFNGESAECFGVEVLKLEQGILYVPWTGYLLVLSVVILFQGQPKKYMNFLVNEKVLVLLQYINYMCHMLFPSIFYTKVIDC